VVEWWSGGVVEWWSGGTRAAGSWSEAKAMLGFWNEKGGGDKGLMKRSLLYQTELRSRKVEPVGFEPTTGGVIAM
jgi:hypothetical protein